MTTTTVHSKKMKKDKKHKREKKRKIDAISETTPAQQQHGHENGDDGVAASEGDLEMHNKKATKKDSKKKNKRQKTSKGKGEDDAILEEVKGSETETAEAARGEGKDAVARFSQLDIVPELKQAIRDVFHEFGDNMTDIQRSSIPAALQYSDTRDIIAQASTGSGKTIAFLVPVLAQLCRDHASGGSSNSSSSSSSSYRKRATGRITAVVLSPVRELALQIHEVAEKLLSHRAMRSKYGLNVGIVVGGVSKHQDTKVLESSNVVVATPGRLADHVNSGTIDMSSVRFFVLDEADMLIDQGFERQIADIVAQMPKNRTTMLFSATMSDKINDLAVLSMRRDPIEIGFEKSKNVSTLEQRYVRVPADKKLAALLAIVNAHKDKKMIIFVSIKKSVEFTTLLLNHLGIEAVELRGNIGQNERTSTFRDFSRRDGGILVATDVAARGLDIPDVDLVIQVDFPEQLPQYFHRAGRTARAGKKGTALLMLNDAEIRNTLGVLKAHLMEDINDKEEKLLEYQLPAEGDELDQYQQQVIDAVYVDPNMWSLANSIPGLYEKVFQMYRRRYGFRDNDFCLRSMQSSFGYGDPSAEAMKRKQQGGNSYNNGGGRAKHSGGRFGNKHGNNRYNNNNHNNRGNWKKW